MVFKDKYNFGFRLVMPNAYLVYIYIEDAISNHHKNNKGNISGFG